MTRFFVDANVIVYAAIASPLRAPCLGLLAAVADEGAQGATSTAVLEEVWHLELRERPAGLDGLTARAHVLFRPVLAVTDEILAEALALDAPTLGANDRIHAATCLVYEIEVIVSADRDFDGVDGLRRVDPGDEPAMRRLVTPPRRR